MREIAISLVLFLTPVCTTAQGSGHQGDGALVKEMQPAQLAMMIGGPELFIYDCNEEDMYAEAHVPGAILTVYDRITSAMLPADKYAILVFYCYSPECPAGATAAKTAMTMGYTDVYSMTAGITGWMDAHLPTQP